MSYEAATSPCKTDLCQHNREQSDLPTSKQARIGNKQSHAKSDNASFKQRSEKSYDSKARDSESHKANRLQPGPRAKKPTYRGPVGDSNQLRKPPDQSMTCARSKKRTSTVAKKLQKIKSKKSAEYGTGTTDEEDNFYSDNEDDDESSLSAPRETSTLAEAHTKAGPAKPFNTRVAIRRSRLPACPFDRTWSLGRYAVKDRYPHIPSPSERLLQHEESQGRKTACQSAGRDVSVAALPCCLVDGAHSTSCLTPWVSCSTLDLSLDTDPPGADALSCACMASARAQAGAKGKQGTRKQRRVSTAKATQQSSNGSVKGVAAPCRRKGSGTKVRTHPVSLIHHQEAENKTPKTESQPERGSYGDADTRSPVRMTYGSPFMNSGAQFEWQMSPEFIVQPTPLLKDFSKDQARSQEMFRTGFTPGSKKARHRYDWRLLSFKGPGVFQNLSQSSSSRRPSGLSSHSMTARQELEGEQKLWSVPHNSASGGNPEVCPQNSDVGSTQAADGSAESEKKEQEDQASTPCGDTTPAHVPRPHDTGSLTNVLSVGQCCLPTLPSLVTSAQRLQTVPNAPPVGIVTSMRNLQKRVASDQQKNQESVWRIVCEKIPGEDRTKFRLCQISNLAKIADSQGDQPEGESRNLPKADSRHKSSIDTYMDYVSRLRKADVSYGECSQQGDSQELPEKQCESKTPDCHDPEGSQGAVDQKPSNQKLDKKHSARNRDRKSQRGAAKSLSAVFRWMREKGCLVNNCSKCKDEEAKLGPKTPCKETKYTVQSPAGQQGQKESPYLSIGSSRYHRRGPQKETPAPVKYRFLSTRARRCGRQSRARRSPSSIKSPHLPATCVITSAKLSSRCEVKPFVTLARKNAPVRSSESFRFVPLEIDRKKIENDIKLTLARAKSEALRISGLSGETQPVPSTEGQRSREDNEAGKNKAASQAAEQGDAQGTCPEGSRVDTNCKTSNDITLKEVLSTHRLAFVPSWDRPVATLKSDRKVEEQAAHWEGQGACEILHATSTSVKAGPKPDLHPAKDANANANAGQVSAILTAVGCRNSWKAPTVDGTFSDSGHFKAHILTAGVLHRRLPSFPPQPAPPCREGISIPHVLRPRPPTAPSILNVGRGGLYRRPLSRRPKAKQAPTGKAPLRLTKIVLYEKAESGDVGRFPLAGKPASSCEIAGLRACLWAEQCNRYLQHRA